MSGICYGKWYVLLWVVYVKMSGMCYGKFENFLS